MATTTPKLVIPTGFENQQTAIERRRRIADAMLERGLTPQPARHVAQVLGQLAQAWAGKSLQRDADKMQTSLNDDIRGSFQAKLTAFAMDEAKVKSGEMSAHDLVQKYRSDPMLESALEPYSKAMDARMTADQRVDYKLGIGEDGKPKTFAVSDAGTIRDAPTGFSLPNTNMKEINGVFVDPTVMQAGDVAPQDPNSMVIRDGASNWISNPIAIGATRMSQGFPGVLPPFPEPGSPRPDQQGAAAAPMEMPESQFSGVPIDKPLGPWLDSITGLQPTKSGAQRPTGVPGTFHATDDARDYGTPTIQENVALGRKLKAQLEPLGIQVIYSENDRSGQHNDHVHVEPGPGLDQMVRAQRSGKSNTQTAVVDGKQYWIINGAVYDNPEGL